MKKLITSSEISGEISAPPSKSFTLRAFFSAFLASGKSKIINPSDCADAKAALQIIPNLGAKIRKITNGFEITGYFPKLNDMGKMALNCNESGACARFISPITGLFENDFLIFGEKTLLEREMHEIEENLPQTGISVKSSERRFPMEFKGLLRGGAYKIDGTKTSQLLSGLLMALPLATEDSTLEVQNLKSRGYVDMTISTLEKFGVKIQNHNYELFTVLGGQKFFPANYVVEGDWSGAAFMLVAAARAGKIEISNLNPNSLQPDARIIEILEKAGAKTIIFENSIKAKKNELNSFEFDAEGCPDLIPPAAALAANCMGTSKISGAKRLFKKESDRAKTLVEEFSKLGVKIRRQGNVLLIDGGEIHGGKVNARGDHRIAMALAIASLNASSPVEISGAETVCKSYPAFWEDFAKVCAK